MLVRLGMTFQQNDELFQALAELRISFSKLRMVARRGEIEATRRNLDLLILNLFQISKIQRLLLWEMNSIAVPRKDHQSRSPSVKLPAEVPSMHPVMTNDAQIWCSEKWPSYSSTLQSINFKQIRSQSNQKELKEYRKRMQRACDEKIERAESLRPLGCTPDHSNSFASTDVRKCRNVRYLRKHQKKHEIKMRPKRLSSCGLSARSKSSAFLVPRTRGIQLLSTWMSFMLGPLRHWLLYLSDLSADDLFQGSLGTGVDSQETG